MSRNPYMDYLKSLSPTWALGYDLSGSTWKDEGSAGADVTVYGLDARTDSLPVNDLDAMYMRGDGIDDYAVGGQDGSLTGVQDGSWAFWVRTDTPVQGVQYIYAVFSIANNQRSWGFNWRSAEGPSPAEILSIIGSDDGASSGLWVRDVELPPADTWAHFVYVRDTGVWKVYRNGALTTSTVSDDADKTFYSSTSANVTVFARDDSPSVFKGDVHTPAMWNGIALTSTQVANLYAAASETPVVSFKHFLRRPMQPIGGFS